MTAITTREVAASGATVKGSPLSNAEVDNNFINLNNEVTPSRATVRPSLLLDFANTKQLDPRITFSRPTTATYYDGKTVVKAEENLLTYSEQFENEWGLSGGATVTANAAVAPNGTSTADLYSLPSGSAGLRGLARNIVASGSAFSGLYTSSVYVKSATGQFIQILYYGGTGYTYANFDIVNGIVGNVSTGDTASIVPVGNGWYRCSLTSSLIANTLIAVNVVTSLTSYRAELVSIASSFYLWGAQLEQRSTVTAYTPTTTAPITNYIPALQTAAANTARFDHDPVTGESKGLLIEEQRTNLVGASANYDYPAWVKSGCTVATGATASPDGTISGILVTALADQAGPRQDLNALSGTTYTSSVYIKAGTCTSLLFRDDVGAGRHLQINPATGQIVATAGTLTGYGSSAVGNGWYRYYMTYAADQNSARHWVRSNSGAGTFYIWGAQCEAGAFATSYIPTQITYTGRASTATYKAADGLIRTAGNGVARYEPNTAGGSNLLLEGAASNLLMYTENQEQSSVWLAGNLVVVQNTAQSPDGLIGAEMLVENTMASAFHYLNYNVTKAAAAIQYTYSFYVKGKGREVGFAVSSGSNGAAARVNPSTGVITGTLTAYGTGWTANSFTINDVGGGWYRVAATFTTDTTTVLNTQISLWNTSLGTQVYTGDGLSGAYIWGAQLEVGSTATSYIPSTETFTGRSSTATYYDSTGTIRTAASGQPRYSYNPSLITAPPKLLLESSSTNIVLNATASCAGNSTTASVSAVIGPDGNYATAVIPTAGSVAYPGSGNQGSQVISHSATTGATAVYSFSGYFKNTGANNYKPYLVIAAQQTGGANPLYALVIFDALNGVFLTKTLNGGWTEVGEPKAVRHPCGMWYVTWSVMFTQQALARTEIYHYLQIRNELNQESYTADGSSGILRSCNQLEINYAPTSYIPTTTAAVTRAADTSTSAAGSRAADVYSSSQVTRSMDNASMTGANFSSWFRQSEGTLYAQAAIIPGISSYPTVFQIGDSSLSNAYSLASNMYYNARVGIRVNNSNVLDAYVGNVNELQSGLSIKWLLSYKTGDNAGVASGTNIVNSTAITPSMPLDRASIGSNVTNNLLLNGWIKRIACYPKRLSNTELQAITS